MVTPAGSTGLRTLVNLNGARARARALALLLFSPFSQTLYNKVFPFFTLFVFIYWRTCYKRLLKKIIHNYVPIYLLMNSMCQKDNDVVLYVEIAIAH